MMTKANNGLNTCYGDLMLDDECLFATRGRDKVHFTRNERAILLVLSRNPNMLLTRGRLLDELAADEDRSDRYVDFLVNRIRLKLRDDPKSPTFIRTRYGEGYVWAATPTATAPVDAVLAIVTKFSSDGQAMTQGASTLVDMLHKVIGAGVSPHRVVVSHEGWSPGTEDRVGNLLHLNFRIHGETLSCAVTLQELSSRRITASFRRDLQPRNSSDLTAETEAISRAVLTALRRGLSSESTGLGLVREAPEATRAHEASIVLLGANPRWADGVDLAAERARDPRNADLAFQWCLHLFSRLSVSSPFESVGLAERERMECEIEATTLEHLPAAEDNPLLMFAAAKLLYYIDRGHLELAEDLAERALAKGGGTSASCTLMGQLRCARGRFDEAVHFFDQGAQRMELGYDFQLHTRAMKCVALLAAGRRPALDAVMAEIDAGPALPSHIALMMDWTFAPHDRPLSPASAKALAAIGLTAARNAVEYSYFTCARQIVSDDARANFMRGLIAQVMRIYGPQAVPPIVGHSIGLNAAA
jgi:DNA-binding winged helix-turn-helix (wHTH) protein